MNSISFFKNTQAYFSFFRQHPFISLHFLILAISLFSFRYILEHLFFPFLGMGWSFVIDQSVPLIIAVSTSAFIFRKNLRTKIKKRLKGHLIPLVLVFLVAFITHLGILYYFFWSDEVIFILRPITQNYAFHLHEVSTANMRGYFLASYAFLFQLFGLNAWVYAFFNILSLAISTLFVYWLVYLLTSKKAISTLAALFFATTPAYMDMFTWFSTAHAPILIIGLVSFITLLYYKKTGKNSYYIISLLFFFAAIKIGFVRSAGFTFIPALLLFLPIFHKIKKSLKQLVVLSLPFIFITVYFCLFEFLYNEIYTSYAPFIQKNGTFNNQVTTSLAIANDRLLGYRGAGENSSLFLSKLSFYTTYLFIPSGLAGEALPILRPLFPKTSLVLSIGNFILISLLATLLFSLKYRGSKKGSVAIFAISFIFLNFILTIIGYQAPVYFNTSVPGAINQLDKDFTNEGLGYGPGSRYLFIPSVGVALLFALFIYWLGKKRKSFFLVSVILCLIIIGTNSYFTIRAQVNNFDGMKKYKSLVADIFKTVPRDGKPKLLFSVNPESNGIDRKFGGWEWLYGFYKKSELKYSTDPEEVKELIKSGQLTRESLYAFYNNPHTLAYADISKEMRELFFSTTDMNSKTTLLFDQKIQNSSVKTGNKTTFIERAVIESSDINQRILNKKDLHFKLKIQKDLNPPLPFSDTIYTGKTEKHSRGFPSNLWREVTPFPMLTDDLSKFKPKDILDQERFNLLNILERRDMLMRYAFISVSNIGKGDNISKDSLIDRFYTTYPDPRISENFFLAKENSVIINLTFPEITDISRLLLNTPFSYSPNTPKRIIISTSLDNINYHQVLVKDLTPEKWSPNKGTLFKIDLPETTQAKFLRLELSTDKAPVALDEIVVDGKDATTYSPQYIFDTTQSAYHFVNSKELYTQLSRVKKYNRLTIIWSCSEDLDWQNQQKNTVEPIRGMWNVAYLNLEPDEREIENKIPINCYGSKLRKIFFISPPYPVEMKLVEAEIE